MNFQNSISEATKLDGIYRRASWKLCVWGRGGGGAGWSGLRDRELELINCHANVLYGNSKLFYFSFLKRDLFLNKTNIKNFTVCGKDACTQFHPRQIVTSVGFTDLTHISSYYKKCQRCWLFKVLAVQN